MPTFDARSIESLLQDMLDLLPESANLILICNVPGPDGFDLVLTNADEQREAEINRLLEKIHPFTPEFKN